MFETPEGKDLVAEEIVPEDHKSLESDAPDDLIDARIWMEFDRLTFRRHGQHG